MCNCKKCGTEFKVPADAIEMVFAIYCQPCIKIALKKMAKMPQKKYMEMQVNIKEISLNNSIKTKKQLLDIMSSVYGNDWHLPNSSLTYSYSQDAFFIETYHNEVMIPAFLTIKTAIEYSNAVIKLNLS
jgi:hypothetical protein